MTRTLMLAFVLATPTLASGSVPARAQPIIIPLQPQNDEKPPPASAPPVAPPMAGPSLPADTQTAGEPAPRAPQQETASQPADAPPPPR